MSSGQSVHEDTEGEMGNRKGKEGHTAVVLPGFYMTGRAMRFCVGFFGMEELRA